MKKFVIILSMIAALSATAFAEDTASVKRDYTINTGDSQVLAGVVESIALSDLTRPNSRMIVTADDGQKSEFVVKPASLIFTGSGGNLLTLHDVATGDRVAVNYRVKDGVKEAVAIKVVK
jgi:hypothetical protein